MTHSRNKKRDDDSSSSDSDSSSSDSSSSSSSSDSSSKKTKKQADDKTKRHRKSPDSEKNVDSKGKSKKSARGDSRAHLEQSKWDSPVEKIKNHRKPTDHNKKGQERSNRRDGPPRESNRRDRHLELDRRDHREDRHRRDDERDERLRRERRERSEERNRRNTGRDRKRRRSRSGSFNHKEAKWGREDSNNSDKKTKEKEKPNFGLSGKLTEETNTYKGIVIKYSEPPEARKPKRRWRLYPFKGEKALQTLYIHRESAYLIGRERKIVDLAVDHPSCSKQHAVLQYRLVPFTKDDGSTGKRVRPYLIDLESANGTFINNKKIDPKKYVELLEKDVIKFGFSSREYVLLHENSKDEGEDDDVKDEEVVEKDKKEKE